jgi:hypothetical protein
MKFRRTAVTVNEDVTLNKGDIKLVNALLLTARCIHTVMSIDRQLELMLEDEKDISIISDILNGEDGEFPYRYITIARKSTGKELASLCVNFTQKVEDNGRKLCKNAMHTA